MSNTLETIKQKIPPVAKKMYKRVKSITLGPTKNVLIGGWFGAFNLGDEMMLDVTLRQFKKNHPQYSLSLLVHKRDQAVENRYSAYRIIVRRGITDEQIAEIVSSHEAFFVNGGALLDSVNYGENIGSSGSHEMTLSYDIARIAKAFTAAKKRTFFYGLSSNSEINNKKFAYDYRTVIQQAEYFSLRDQFSKGVLAKIASTHDMPIVDDIEFADPVIQWPSASKTCRQHITIIPILYDSTIDAFERLVNTILDATPLNVKLVMFYDENDNDMRMAYLLRSRLGDRKYRVNTVTVPVDSEELFYELQDAKAVFSMRYHGTLFAGAIGKPTICINWSQHPHYKNKNQYLAEQYGFVAGSIEFSKVKELSPNTVRQLLDTPPNKVSASQIYRRANKQLRSIIKQV